MALVPFISIHFTACLLAPNLLLYITAANASSKSQSPYMPVLLAVTTSAAKSITTTQVDSSNRHIITSL